MYLSSEHTPVASVYTFPSLLVPANLQNIWKCLFIQMFNRRMPMPSHTKPQLEPAQKKAHDNLVRLLDSALKSGNVDLQVTALKHAAARTTMPLTPILQETLESYLVAGSGFPHPQLVIGVITDFGTDSAYEGSKFRAVESLTKIMQAPHHNGFTRSGAINGLGYIIGVHPQLATNALQEQVDIVVEQAAGVPGFSSYRVSDFRKTFNRAVLRSAGVAPLSFSHFPGQPKTKGDAIRLEAQKYGF